MVYTDLGLQKPRGASAINKLCFKNIHRGRTNSWIIAFVVKYMYIYIIVDKVVILELYFKTYYKIHFSIFILVHRLL